MTDPHDDVEDLTLYDSERKALSEVFAALSRSIGSHRSLEGWREEAVNRFAEVGFRVKVTFLEDLDEVGEKTVYPDITILGRVEREDGFDHDRMAHEVQTDVLGTGRRNDSRVAPVSVPGFSKSKSGLYVPGK